MRLSLQTHPQECTNSQFSWENYQTNLSISSFDDFAAHQNHKTSWEIWKTFNPFIFPKHIWTHAIIIKSRAKNRIQILRMGDVNHEQRQRFRCTICTADSLYYFNKYLNRNINTLQLVRKQYVIRRLHIFSTQWTFNSSQCLFEFFQHTDFLSLTTPHLKTLKKNRGFKDFPFVFHLQI